MATKPSPQGVPKESIFQALGRLVFAFSHLEESLAHALATALGDSDEAAIVVSGLSFNQAVDRFSVLYSVLDEVDFNGGLRGLCNEMAKVNEERNGHIHSSWGFGDSGVPTRLRTRLHRHHGVSLRMESIDPELVIGLARRMDELTELVYELRARYLEHRRRRPILSE